MGGGHFRVSQGSSRKGAFTGALPARNGRASRRRLSSAARHVIDAPGDRKSLRPSVTILMQDLREIPAYLNGEHALTDVALYRVEPSAALKLPGAVSFAATDPQTGEDIFTLGSPLDWGATVTYGRVGSEGAFL